MDIARLGVVLDPSKFKSGESEVLASLRRIEAAIRGSAGTITNESKKGGTAFSSMASAARTAASGMRSAFDGMANSVGMFSPKLGFALQALRGFSAMIGSTASGLKSLASGTAAAGGGLAGLARAMTAVVAVTGTLTIAVGGLLAILLPLVVAFKAASLAWDLFADGLKKAGEFESMQVRFAGMLGSMEEAEKRMESLSKLADKTPFELDEIVRANITLQSMTEGMWANEKAMLAIGDASAKSGLKIDDFASRIGRIFSGIKNNGEWLEPMRTLAAEGGLEGDLASRVTKMRDEGKTLKEVWDVVIASMEKSKNAMENLSKTFEGRSSTMSDAWSKLKRTLGEAILPAAKDLIIGVTDALTKLAEFANTHKEDIKAFADQIEATFMTLSQPGGWEAATAALKGVFDDGWTATMDKVNAWIKQTFGIDLAEHWKKLGTPEFWAPLSATLLDIAKSFGQALWNSAADGAKGIVQTAFKNTPTNSPTLMKAVEALGTPLRVAGSAARIMSGEEAPPFQSDLDLPTDGGGTSALNTLPDITAENTEATKQLTGWFESSVRPENEQLTGAPLFGQMNEANLLTIEQNRAAQVPNQFKQPPNKEADWNMVLGSGKEKKEKKDPLDTEAMRIHESLRTPAEEMQDTIANLEKLRAAGKLSEEDFVRGSKKAKEEYVSSVKEMTEAAKKAAEEQMTALEKLMAGWGDLSKQWDQASVAIAESVSSNITTALVDMMEGTKSASEAFAAMAKSIVADILRIITQMMTQYAIQSALGMVMGTAGTGAAIGAAASSGAMVFHSGGIVGAGGSGRGTSASFHGAEKYHMGGATGLAPNEVPIIAERGERILTADDQANMRNRLRGDEKKEAQTKQPITILNVTDPRQIDEHLLKNPDLIMNAISRRMPQMRQMLKSG